MHEEKREVERWKSDSFLYGLKHNHKYVGPMKVLQTLVHPSTLAQQLENILNYLRAACFYPTGGEFLMKLVTEVAYTDDLVFLKDLGKWGEAFHSNSFFLFVNQKDCQFFLIWEQQTPAGEKKPSGHGNFF